MRVLVCEVCENRGLNKEGQRYVCPSCGASYATEDVKKLLKEVGEAAPAAPAAPVVPAETGKYLKLARQAVQTGNSAEAAKFYSMAKEEDPNSWECVFYTNYYVAMDTKIAAIVNAANLVRNSISVSVDLLGRLQAGEREEAAGKMAKSVMTISAMLINAARRHYNSIDASIQHLYNQERIDREKSAMNILREFVDRFGENFPEDRSMGEIRAVVTQQLLHYNWDVGMLTMNEIVGYIEQVAKYDKKAAKPLIERRIVWVKNWIDEWSKTGDKPDLVIALCLWGLGSLAAAIVAIMFIALDSGPFYPSSLIFFVPSLILLFLCIRGCFPKKYPEEELEKRSRWIKQYEGYLQRLNALLESD